MNSMPLLECQLILPQPALAFGDFALSKPTTFYGLPGLGAQIFLGKTLAVSHPVAWLGCGCTHGSIPRLNY